MSETLYFARNDRFFPWCLERLAKTSTTKNAKSLVILQGPAVYYTALGVKRDTGMTAARVLKAITAAEDLQRCQYLQVSRVGKYTRVMHCNIYVLYNTWDNLHHTAGHSKICTV